MPELKGEPEQDDSAEQNRLRKPAAEITWYDAIEFCNRLSRREDLPIYYQFEVDESTREAGHFLGGEVSVIDPNGKGYRLPTVKEWEYATRAMSRTDYYYGNSLDLMSEYAAMTASSTYICGRHIPNPWGLFDMHGNVYEWCWDSNERGFRHVRGGAFINSAVMLRSSNRNAKAPDDRLRFVGFRVCRTR